MWNRVGRYQTNHSIQIYFSNWICTIHDLHVVSIPIYIIIYIFMYIYRVSTWLRILISTWTLGLYPMQLCIRRIIPFSI